MPLDTWGKHFQYQFPALGNPLQRMTRTGKKTFRKRGRIESHMLRLHLPSIKKRISRNSGVKPQHVVSFPFLEQQMIVGVQEITIFQALGDMPDLQVQDPVAISHMGHRLRDRRFPTSQFWYVANDIQPLAPNRMKINMKCDPHDNTG